MYPKDRALSTAITIIGQFLLKHEMTVYLVVYDKKSYSLSEKLFSSIEEYIDDNYVDEHKIFTSNWVEDLAGSVHENVASYENTQLEEIKPHISEKKIKKRDLEDLVKNIDETFSVMLLRLIDDRELKDSDVYKKANVTKQTFSRIRNNVTYTPSKATVIAFAIALELSLDETKDLLQRAGFALSMCSHFDIIIRFFIENEEYNIFEINEALFAFDQNLLGV
jgi:transcriptional regulator with XRE-family HTH domain